MKRFLNYFALKIILPNILQNFAIYSLNILFCKIMVIPENDTTGQIKFPCVA